MMAKIDVNGANASPLYQWLTAEAPGLLGSKAIKWNFTKFLVGKDGRVIRRYAPQDAPKKLGGILRRHWRPEPTAPARGGRHRSLRAPSQAMMSLSAHIRVLRACLALPIDAPCRHL